MVYFVVIPASDIMIITLTTFSKGRSLSHLMDDERTCNYDRPVHVVEQSM